MQVVASGVTARRRLQRAVPPAVWHVVNRLRRLGGTPVVVGGAVRSAFLGQLPADWDIAVDLPPAAVAGAFTRVVRHGERHGTVMVLTAAGPVEITSFADATGPWQERLRADLQRRDFTFNTLAWDPTSGEIYDLFNGVDDLGQGVVRGVADPLARLREDPLRALRAVRFVAQFGFRLDAATSQALTSVAGALRTVAAERQGHEMQRILASDQVAAGLQAFCRCELNEAVAPNLRPTAGHLRVVAALPPLPWLRLATCLWLTGGTPEELGGLLLGWRVSKSEIRLATTWLWGAYGLTPKPPTAAAQRIWAAGVGRDAAADCWRMAAARWPKAYAGTLPGLQRVLRRACLHVGQLAVNGDDLRQAGVAPREMGAVLARLLREVLVEPRLNRRSALLRRSNPP